MARSCSPRRRKARQERLNNSGLAVTQFECALGLMDGFVQQALPEVSVRKSRMGAPGSGLGFDSSVEVLSCFIRLAFPHERAGQGQQGARMVWREGQDFFQTILAPCCPWPARS